MSSSSAGQREKPELEAVHGGADLVFGQWRRFIKEKIKAQFQFLTRDTEVAFNFPPSRQDSICVCVCPTAALAQNCLYIKG